jgi:hypothetical protein
MHAVPPGCDASNVVAPGRDPPNIVISGRDTPLSGRDAPLSGRDSRSSGRDTRPAFRGGCAPVGHGRNHLLDLRCRHRGFKGIPYGNTYNL